MGRNSSPKSLPVFSLSTARSYMNKLPNGLYSKVQPHFSCGKVIVPFFRTSERRSRCKRNKCTGYPQLFIGCNGETQNSQCKPVNNCGGSRIFLKLWFEIWKSG